MDDIESYLILKYGSLSKAYHLWINLSMTTTMDQEEYDTINTFFAVMSLRDRLALSGKHTFTTWQDERRTTQ